MHTCPSCHDTDRQVKVGFNPSGTQRFLCKACGRKYPPQPKFQGYGDDIRRQAVRLCVDGLNLRRIARQLGVVHQTVANWVAAHAATPPAVPPAPSSSPSQPLDVVELDELYPSEGEKKTAST
jgi:transposase-like protein